MGVSGQLVRISYDAGFVVGLTLASASVLLLTVVMFFWLRRRLTREKALLERDATSRHLIEHARDAIITLDEAGLVVYFNPAAELMFGYNSREATGLRFQTLVPSPYGLSPEAPQVQEITAIRKDGTQFAADLMLSELSLGDRSLLSAIIRDVSERKHADRALRGERNFTSAILDAAAALIVVIDQEGRIVRFNRFAQAVTGYSDAEAIGAVFTDLLLSGESAEVKASLTTPSGQVRQVVEECWCHTRKGLRKIVWTATSFQDGQKHLIVCVGTDVTERRAMEVRLLQSEKMQAVGRLAGGIAHDFNNLLTAITGYAELLLDSVPPSSPLRRDLLEIQGAGERAASLTRQLLTFSRGQVSRPAVLDLNAVIRHMESMLGRLIGEHIQLVLELDDHLWHIRADRTQMEQVLLNLVLNARDAMPQGGTVTVRTRNAAEERVELEVTDTGCGMDEDTRQRIFEPFFTTKDSGRGTGLGLSTVYAIVQQAAGAIAVESMLQVGTTFRVTLPRELSNLEPAAMPATLREARGGTERILVIEDQEEVRSLAARVLRMKGYTVIEAADAAEARSITEEGKVDLLLSDVILPGINGPALVEELLPANPGLKALFVSGYDDQSLENAGIILTDPFLRKPFSAEELVSKVREVLDTRRVLPR